MSDALIELIRRRSQPMEPLPTDAEPRTAPLGTIRAVLFDVYGTLFTSGSGDVGTAAAMGRSEALIDALAAEGILWNGDPQTGIETLIETIRESHAESESEYPEVDIRLVWEQLLTKFVERQQVEAGPPIERARPERLALEYELRVNPVWPMPDTRETLETIRRSGRQLGIVSNAQYFTPLLLSALLNEPAELGFDDSLCFYSYAFLEAKPGRFLYERAKEALTARGIAPEETLYVGNDLLNDITPASQVGFRTALYAGDQRSLRLREGDPRVQDVEPDWIVTELRQIAEGLDGTRDQGRVNPS